jgi:hypothetical protein
MTGVSRRIRHLIAGQSRVGFVNRHPRPLLAAEPLSMPDPPADIATQLRAAMLN